MTKEERFFKEIFKAEKDIEECGKDITCLYTVDALENTLDLNILQALAAEKGYKFVLTERLNEKGYALVKQ